MLKVSGVTSAQQRVINDFLARHAPLSELARAAIGSCGGNQQLYRCALSRLESSARDAVEMAEVLANPGIGAFEVTSIVDGSAHAIRLAVQDLLEERHRGDLVLVYLSCHGLLDKQDRLYFAARIPRRIVWPRPGWRRRGYWIGLRSVGPPGRS